MQSPKALSLSLGRWIGVLLLSATTVPAFGHPASHLDLASSEVVEKSDLVTLRLQLQDSEPMFVTVPSGEVVTYAHAGFDYRIALRPLIEDEDAEVTVEIFSATEEAGRLRLGRYLGVVHVARGRSAVSSHGQALPLEITVTDRDIASGAGTECLKPARESPSDELGQPFVVEEQRNRDFDGCCLTCGGQTTCGCAVASSCGTCCACNLC